ncbi:MAG: hypothetical protein JKY52_01810 [Flavobacteriales bacterium]|nr:hypothetical protein [Flavobacteriales bacterium]
MDIGGGIAKTPTLASINMRHLLLIIIVVLSVNLIGQTQDSSRIHSTYVCDTIYVDNNQLLHWSTRLESGSLPYIVEQYLWGRWRKIGEVKGVGESGKHKYSLDVNFISGMNRFRVKQLDFAYHNGEIYFPPRITPQWNSEIKLDEVSISITKNNVSFSRPTLYILSNKGENIDERVVSFGDSIDTSNQKGKHRLNFDNATKEIRLK